MARHVRRPSASARRLGCVLLAAALGAHEVFAQDAVAPSATSRLRAPDEKSAALLQAGNARSATFRRLTQVIERSDLVVYVQTHQLNLPGQLQFVSATPGGRYLRVSVRVPGLDNDLVPWLAHELWHAVEVAGAPEIKDGVSLVRYYERLHGGFRAGGTAKMVRMETVQAQKSRTMVFSELHGF